MVFFLTFLTSLDHLLVQSRPFFSHPVCSILCDVFSQLVFLHVSLSASILSLFCRSSARASQIQLSMFPGLPPPPHESWFVATLSTNVAFETANNLTKHVFRKILLASLVRQAHDNVIADLPKQLLQMNTQRRSVAFSAMLFIKRC